MMRRTVIGYWLLVIGLMHLFGFSAFPKGGNRGGQIYTATIFCDSAAGNDANNGLTPFTPKKTIAAIRAISPSATSIIGLKRGSYWPEQLYGLPAGAQVIAYGTGNAPVLDSSDLATGWTATNGRANVWEIAWTKDTSPHACGGTCYLMLWEGALQLPGAASVTACEAAAGTFYEDTGAGKVYYHPTGNVSPAAYQVNITKRFEGIYQYNAAVTVDGVRCRRSDEHYGGISNGPGGTVQNSIVDGCGIHHMVVARGLVQDTIFLETSPRYISGTTPIAFYEPDATGLMATARRLFMIGAAATKALPQGSFYAHAVDDAHKWDTVNYDQVYVSYGYGPTASTTNLNVTNSFIENGSAGVIMAGTPSITRSLFRNCTGVGSVPAMSIITGGTSANVSRSVTNSVVYLSDILTDSIFAFRIEGQQGTFTLTNCVIHLNVPLRSGAGIYGSANSGQSLAVVINNCVIVVPKGGFPAIQLAGSNVTYTGDYNVFVRTDSSPSGIPFYWAGSYLEGLTNWRTSSGQDAHSVYLSASQQATFWSGTVANGDFRINASNAVTDANGTIYTGQFSDGAALSTAGVQQYWNWNTRAIVNTAPVAWPVPPQTIAQANAYVNSPATWNFYPL